MFVYIFKTFYFDAKCIIKQIPNLIYMWTFGFVGGFNIEVILWGLRDN